jgi:quercetin dioxygenase-like cupin family protein
MAEAVNQRARRVLSPEEGERVWLRKLGIRFMIGGEETQGNFALVEYLIGARALAAPMHTHEHEEEYTHVLEGEIGVQIGEEVLVAQPGELVFKPRGVPHAFWNASDEPARALEIISPAGFERYFAELAPLFPPANQGPLDEAAVDAVREKYGLEMDMGSIHYARRASWPCGRRASAFREVAPPNKGPGRGATSALHTMPLFIRVRSGSQPGVQVRSSYSILLGLG